MKWLLLLALTLHTSGQCDKQERRCIESCNRQHTIGSMNHLQCKQECWDTKRECNQ